MLYIDQLRTPSFPIGLVKTESGFIVRSVEIGLGRLALVVAVITGLLQSGKVRGKRVIFTLVGESQGKSRNFVKSQGRISNSQGNFFRPSGYLYSPLILIF